MIGITPVSTLLTPIKTSHLNCHVILYPILYFCACSTILTSCLLMQGLDYSSGVWQFEGHAFVPNGTSGQTIVQIHGAAHSNTTILLRIFEGNMRYYSSDIVATNLYDKWFRLNLIHDVNKGKLKVFIDGKLKFHIHDQGPGDLYFKCGVYAAPRNISYYMESRWRDIKLYKML